MIAGQIRIIAKTKEEAEEIAGYLWRLTKRNAIFRRAKLGQRDEWICYGEIEMPDDQDTRTWKKVEE